MRKRLEQVASASNPVRRELSERRPKLCACCLHQRYKRVERVRTREPVLRESVVRPGAGLGAPTRLNGAMTETLRFSVCQGLVPETATDLPRIGAHLRGEEETQRAPTGDWGRFQRPR
jgi:hypothetical protein